MNTSKDARFALRLGATALALVMVACSSAPSSSLGEPPTGDDSSSTKKGKDKSNNGSGDDTSTDDTSGDDNTTTNGNQTNDTDGGTTSTPDSGTTPTGGACSAETTGDACYQCCDATDPTAMDPAYQAFDDCACQTACASQCGASYCAGKQPTAACETCLNNATTCQQAADAACNGSAACKAVVTCYDASGCDTKP
ncbi:MAG: hypothetical protein JWM74_1804 [Myxococcaceae bacterium]|jgi:hypothetical protein|nr:hypothetical protein [Myxococcaceae bacterium]